MCGLVGIMKPSKMNTNDVKCFKNMLYADALRGHHSTGVFSLATKTSVVSDNTFEGSVHKAAGTMLAAIKDKDAGLEGAISTRAGLLLGHNRYATMGAHTAANAHPFEHGDVVLAHNGTLWDHYDLTTDYFHIDSEAICKAMSLVDPSDAGNVIKQLKGAFTLTWWDYRDSSFNMVRNDERPMFYAIANGNLYYASEKLMLEWCLDRNNIVADEVIELPVGKHYKWKLSGFSATSPVITEVELNKEQDPYTRGWYGSAYSSYGSSTRRTSYVTQKSEAEKEAEELGFKKGNLFPAWMFDYKTVANSTTGKWEGLSQDDSYTQVFIYGGNEKTFADEINTGGIAYVKATSFYYTKGVDKKNYLVINGEAKAYTEEDFLRQEHSFH